MPTQEAMMTPFDPAVLRSGLMRGRRERALAVLSAALYLAMIHVLG